MTADSRAGRTARPSVRLVWRAADPEATARRIARRLGIAPTRGEDGMPLLAFERVAVPVRPHAGPSSPTLPARLRFEPSGDGSERATEAVPSGAASLQVLATGWATVDRERAAAELAGWLDGPAPESTASTTEDPHLGATALVLNAPALPGGRLVLLEPFTEGRVAASLARDGEGPCTLYLAPVGGLEAWRSGARERGTLASRPNDGPFGPAVVVLDGGPAGPHLVVCEGP